MLILVFTLPSKPNQNPSAKKTRKEKAREVCLVPASCRSAMHPHRQARASSLSWRQLTRPHCRPKTLAMATSRDAKQRKAALVCCKCGLVLSTSGNYRKTAKESIGAQKVLPALTGLGKHCYCHDL